MPDVLFYRNWICRAKEVTALQSLSPSLLYNYHNLVGDAERQPPPSPLQLKWTIEMHFFFFFNIFRLFLVIPVHWSFFPFSFLFLVFFFVSLSFLLPSWSEICVRWERWNQFEESGNAGLGPAQLTTAFPRLKFSWIYCSSFVFGFFGETLGAGEASGNELGNPSIAITEWMRKSSSRKKVTGIGP